MGKKYSKEDDMDLWDERSFEWEEIDDAEFDKASKRSHRVNIALF